MAHTLSPYVCFVVAIGQRAAAVAYELQRFKVDFSLFVDSCFPTRRALDALTAFGALA